MGKLDLFLKSRRLADFTEKIPLSQSFADEEGNPLMWELKPVSAAEDEALRLSSVKRGEKGSFELDTSLYAAKLAAETVVFPDLNDAKLQDSYGVMGSERLLKEMLKAGEYQRLLKEVRRINGFGEITGELAEEAKN